MGSVFWVDIPNPDGDEWANVATFPTRDEAVRFVKNTYLGDDEGKISLITEGNDGMGEKE